MAMVSVVDRLTADIIRCIIRVHQVLGPGFVEKIYQRALIIELRRSGLPVEVEKRFAIYYGSENVGYHQIDLIVGGLIIVELKAMGSLGKRDYAQVRSYLKAAHLDLALLVNFAGERADFRRVTV